MKIRSFFQLHLSVFLFGFTAILGDLIQLETVPLVWWRVSLTVLFLLFLVNPVKSFQGLGKKAVKRHILIGFLVSVHWLAFYGSIKISNASIVLIAMSTTSLFTALAEPLIIRTAKYRTFDLVLSILVIPAMVLIYYNATEVQQEGLWLGLFASLVGAIFSIFNKIWLIDGKEMEVVFVQQSTVLLVLLILFLFPFTTRESGIGMPGTTDWIYLVIFAAVCTIWPYILYLKAMKWLSAFDVSFAFNMEPVYGLILAAIILADHKEINFKIYLGMLFIIALVLVHTFMKAELRKRKKLSVN